MSCMFNRKNRKVVCTLPPEVKLCCGYSSIWTVVYPACPFITLSSWLCSNWYDQPGQVGLPAVQVVDVWALGIVVSAWLIETTLFMGKLLM